MFSIVLLGSCGQGSQNKDDSEIVETQLPDSLITEDYIKNNLVIPNKPPERRQREVISFTILTDGSIGKNIRSISKKEVCTGCRAAAITLLSRMPKWVPAMKEGKTVAMSMTIPITF